jgi:(p)ppGpp synthase/HD superfamily hydrolase
MKRGQDLAATADQRHRDKPGRLHIGRPERLMCHLLSATAQEATVARPHDVAEGTDVAREHLKNAFGPQAAAVDAITGLVTQPRDHRPGCAFRAADLGRHISLECSPRRRCQCDAIPFRSPWR